MKKNQGRIHVQSFHIPSQSSYNYQYDISAQFSFWVLPFAERTHTARPEGNYFVNFTLDILCPKNALLVSTIYISSCYDYNVT
jgi:hypothetical protein